MHMILHSMILSLLFKKEVQSEKRKPRHTPLSSQWSLTALGIFLPDSAMPLFKGKKERHLMGSDKLPQILPLSEQLSAMHAQRIWGFISRSRGWQRGHVHSFFVSALSLLSRLSLAWKCSQLSLFTRLHIHVSISM